MDLVEEGSYGGLVHSDNEVYEDLKNTLEELATRLEELLISFTFGREPPQATTDFLDYRLGEVLEILSLLYEWGTVLHPTTPHVVSIAPRA
jgi:hypothetical protein